MDTDQLVLEITSESGGLNETELATAGEPARKDGEEANLNNEMSHLSVSKESRAEETNKPNYSKKGHGKVSPKTSPRNVAGSVKKNKDGKIGSVASKQPLASATNRRSSIDGHSPQSIKSVGPHSPSKLTSAAKSASKHSGKSNRSSPTTSTAESGGVSENAEHPMPQEQEQSAHFERNLHSPPISPTGTCTRAQRGSLPSYGFNFRCEERAHKRKEFYAKIEEKIHAKEVEKSILEEKSKEKEEAEIKKYRKSLKFKATPLPSFYHEPPPPKVELKKTPPTRARSPKFGRSTRSTCLAECEEHGSDHSGRASLDGRGTALNHAKKGTFPQHCERPRRRSLPKLPSERSSLSGATEDEQHPQERQGMDHGEQNQSTDVNDADAHGEAQEHEN